jgi:hypothetical protein
MDRDALEEFAAAGFSWFSRSGIGLDVIAEWCNEQASSDGDQRYWILGASFLALDEWWAARDHEGGIGVNEYIALNESIKNHLQTILDEADAPDAARRAGSLALRIQAVIDGRVPATLYRHDDDAPE